MEPVAMAQLVMLPNGDMQTKAQGRPADVLLLLEHAKFMLLSQMNKPREAVVERANPEQQRVLLGK